MIYCGEPPKSLGVFPTPSPEMMYFLYLPVKLPDGALRLPERLRPYLPMVKAARDDHGDWFDKYVYLTCKTMFVDASCPGNRPGWHIDGFQSNGDINYVWANMNPTEFAIQDFFDIPDDDQQSMIEVEKQIDPSRIQTFEDNTLLRLDETVVHRVSPNVTSGKRSFCKITISDHQFVNEGNSHNHLIDYAWDSKPRTMERNLDHGK